MKLVVKSSPNDQLLHKKELGFKNIELHLSKEKTSIEDYENVINVDTIDVTTVHTPIYNGLDIDLNSIVADNFYFSLRSTCDLAQKLATHYNHPIFVVIHNSLSKKEWEMYDDVRKKVISRLKIIVNDFPDLNFVIENTTPYEKNFLNTGYDLIDINTIVSYINKEIPGNKFGALLDVCHTLMGYRIRKFFVKNFNLTKEEYLEKQFIDAGENFFMVHLANMKQDGFGADHGTAFNNEPDDLKLLEHLLLLCQKYLNPHQIVCLEIREDSYYDCKNLKETIKNIQMISEKLNVKFFN